MPGEFKASGTSELRANFERISKMLGKTLVTDEDIQNYQQFTDEIKALNELSDYFYTPNEGVYPVVDSLSLNALKASYERVIKSCNTVINNNSNEGASPNMKAIAKELKDYLEEDHAALEVYVEKEEKPHTLDKIIELGRTKTVDVGAQNLGTVGGMMSQRIPLSVQGPDGKREGFFTKTVNLDVTSKLKNTYDKYKAQYPTMTEFINTMEAADPVALSEAICMNLADFMAIGRLDADDLDDYIEEGNIDAIKSAVIGGIQENTKKIIPADVFNNFKNNPDFIKFIKDIGNELQPVIQDYKCYLTSDGKVKWLGLEDGANVDKRNAAMTAVSDLISDKKNIARSEPMIVMIDGVPTSGTFMERADGWNADNYSAENPILTADSDVYDNYRIFDDIADLQVKDFICGNLDRHEGNFQMIFGEVDGKQKLIQIKGIDNDMSFGLYVPGDDPEERVGNRFVTPKNMGVIGKETAMRVLAITKETLVTVLKGYSLSKEEMETAWKRTEMLKKAINEGMEHYKDDPDGRLDQGFLRSVPQDKWDKYSLKTLAQNDNQFSVLKDLKATVTDMRISDARKKRDVQTSNKIASFILNEQPQPEMVKPPLEYTEAVPIGTGLITIDPVMDRIGVNNPDNVKIVVRPEEALGTAGNNSSSRVPLSYKNKNGQEIPGYFTFSSTVNAENQIKRYVDSKIAELDKDDAHPEWKNILVSTYNYIKQDMPKASVDFNANNYDLTKVGVKRGKAEELKANEEFNQFFSEFLGTAYQKYNKVISSYGSDGIAADRNGRIETRNVAVSKMSTLLGAENVIVKAGTMQIQVGNKIHDGVFMEETPGTKIENIKPGSPDAGLTSAAFDNTKVLKDIADMQILGYICQNVNMNENSFLCTFSEKEPKKATGIKGIGNDYSFGTKKIAADDTINNSIPLNNIKVISEGMSYRITHMDPKALDHTLSGQGLSDAEVAAAKERFYQIFDKIKDKSICVVKDSEWENYKLTDLAGEKNAAQHIDTTNFFNVVKNAYDIVLPQHLQDYQNLDEDEMNAAEHAKNKAKADEVQDFSQEAKDVLEIEQQESAVSDEINNKLLDRLNKDKPGVVRSDHYIVSLLKKSVDQMADSVDSASSAFYGGTEFNDLKSSTVNLKQQIKELNRKVNGGGALTKDDLNQVLSNLNNVNETAIIYSQYKVDDLERRGKNPEKPGRVPAKRLGAALNARNISDALYSNVKNFILVRDIVASPETEVYERITKHQTEAEADNIQPDHFAKNLASIIYFNVVLNHIEKFKSENKVINALYQNELDRNVKEIIESEAFQKMIENTPHEELLANSREMNGQKLFKAFVKYKAFEKKNENPQAEKRKSKEEKIASQMAAMKEGFAADMKKLLSGIDATYGIGKSDKSPSDLMRNLTGFMNKLNKKNLSKLTPEEFSDALDVLESKADNYLNKRNTPSKDDRIKRNSEVLKIKWAVADYRSEMRSIWAGKGGHIHDYQIGQETKNNQITETDIKKNLIAFALDMSDMCMVGIGQLPMYDPESYAQNGVGIYDPPEQPTPEFQNVLNAMKDWHNLSTPTETGGVRPVSFDIIKEKLENLNKAASIYMSKNSPGTEIYSFVETTRENAVSALKNVYHLEPMMNLEINGEKVGGIDVISLAKNLDNPYKNLVAISNEGHILSFGKNADRAWESTKEALGNERSLAQIQYGKGRKLKESILTANAADANLYNSPARRNISEEDMSKRMTKLSCIATEELFATFADESEMWHELSHSHHKDKIISHLKNEFSKVLMNDAKYQNVIKASTSLNVKENILKSAKKDNRLNELKRNLGPEKLMKDLKKKQVEAARGNQQIHGPAV